ncbi:MAG: TolC family protein [Syntrophaceae bacterium]|nr:TolC family protein [Syntrophaceae bacterium]
MDRHGPCARVLLAGFLIFCLNVQIGQTLLAQSFTPPPVGEESEGLTLSAAVDLALLNNPRIKAALSTREEMDAQVREARSGWWPLLQFSETFTRSNNPVFVFGSLLEQSRFGVENFVVDSLNNPDSLNNFRTAINLKWPVFDQMQSSARVAQARIGQEQADHQGEMVRQQVRFEVLRAYFGVLLAQQRKEVTEETVKMAESDRRRVEALFRTGMVVQSDLLSAEVQLSEFRQQQVQASGDIITAHAFLNTVLGTPVQTIRRVAGQLTDKLFFLAEPDELIRQALQNRPDYARAGSAVKLSEEGVRGAKGNYLPRVDLFSSYGISGRDLTSGSSDYAVGAGLTFNLFDSGRGARLDKARAAQSTAAAEQEHLANQIRLEVIQAYQDYVSARERLKLADQTVTQAQEALRIVQDRYKEGLTTITEVLRAETALLRTRLNLVSSRYEHYIGYARVLMATGKLTDVAAFNP